MASMDAHGDEAMKNGYIFKMLIAVDMFFASVIWRDSGITISSMTGLALHAKTPPLWAVVLGRWILNKIQPNHCELAITHDIVRARNALSVLNGSS